jgi:hypothetical protein
MRTFPRFLSVLSAVAVPLLGGAAALNLAVDPHAEFPATGLASLDEFRDNASRRNRAERLARGGWDVVIIGSSRAISWDPRSPHWEGARVYNAGLKGTNVHELRRVLDFTLDHGRPRRIVLHADLLGFTDRRTVNADFAESLFNPDRDVVELGFKRVLGWGAILDARSVLRDSREPPGGQHVGANGSNAGYAVRPRTWKGFTDGLRSGFFAEVGTYNGFRYSTERVEMVKAMVRRCRAEGVEVTVVVPPVHALQLEAMRLMGIWGEFERMKGDLLDAAAPAEVWDFTGYGEPWSEPVPMEGKAPMKWFRDTSHATSELSEIAIGRILGRPVKDLPGFGVRLTRANLAAHLAAIRADRETYVREHAAEVEGVRAIFRETEAERARNLMLAGD